jgi:uncharacterized SAM-binding protein YcdF (DUF218 family)
VLLKTVKVLAVMGALASLFILQDFIRFALACRSYGKLAQTEEAQLKPLQPNESEALVVLTGDRARIPRALELLKKRPQSWLLISGVSKKTSLAEVVSYQSGGLTGDANLWDRVILDTNATSTVENAEETEKILKAKKAQQMVLITSDYHMERALRIFKRWVSVDIKPYAVSSELTGGNPVDWPAAVAKFLFEYWKWVAFRFDIY